MTKFCILNASFPLFAYVREGLQTRERTDQIAFHVREPGEEKERVMEGM
jgi:hypothetical protein